MQKARRNTLRGLLLLGVLLGGGCGGEGDSQFPGVEAGGAGGGLSADGGAGSGQPSSLDGGGGMPSCNGSGARFVTEVRAVEYGPGQDFGRTEMPEIVYGPPLGGGCCAGSTDVVSLGNGGQIVVGFGDNGILDGPGVDFVVFENAFEIGGDPEHLFAELATVAVSSDGLAWEEFDCTAVAPPYGSCAGWHPVLLNGDDGPLDPATAGGDGFDLAEIGVSWARYVRITDRSDIDGATGVFDLDAVGIVNALCP